MNYLQKLSIKTKLTLVIISVSLFAIILGFTIISFFNISNLKKDLINQSSLIAKLLAEYSEYALLFDDTKTAVEDLENVKIIPSIKGAELYDANGHFFASYDNQKASTDSLKINEPRYEYINSELEILEPIYSSDNELIGTIFLRVSLDELNENVRNFVLWMFLIILVVTIVITLMASSFQKIISRPILDLANLTSEISRTRDYSMRIHKKSNDEIGILYDSFNNMLEVIVRNEMAMLQAQDELRDSEEQFSTFMEMLPAAAFIKENDSTYRYVNKFLNEQFEANRWIGGKLLSELPSQKKQFSTLNDNLALKETQNFEEYVYDIKNELRYFETWKFPIQRKEKSTLIGGIAIDITKRKLYENKINYYIKELERNNQELEEFNYVASHDLREPLRTITSYCDLLEEDIGDNINDMVKEDLKFITDATTRMNILIQDLLQLSRAGRVEFESEKIDLNEIIKTVLRDLELKIKETKSNIICEKLPTILGDYTQLSRVFQNLFTNAIKFKSDQDPEIKIYSKTLDNFYEIIVEDNGIGIDREYQNQIFSAFKRLHSREKYEGTGIGLAICKKIIERHNGTIRIESEVGVGSKFIISLKKNE
jgi:PAS domain S-box-containing protein